MLLALVSPDEESPEIPAETPVPPLPPELRASFDAEPEPVLPPLPPLAAEDVAPPVVLPVVPLLPPAEPPSAEPDVLLPEVEAPPVAVPLLWVFVFVLVPPSA